MRKSARGRHFRCTGGPDGRYTARVGVSARISTVFARLNGPTRSRIVPANRLTGMRRYTGARILFIHARAVGLISNVLSITSYHTVPALLSRIFRRRQTTTWRVRPSPHVSCTGTLRATL